MRRLHIQIPVTTSGRTHPYHPRMRPRYFLSVATALILIPVISAQNGSILNSEGDSVKANYSCNDEDLQWAGMACSEDDPCPIYLELSSIAASGRTIFVSGDFHSTSATLSSLLIMSDDGGVTWKESGTRVRGAAIDQLQFRDAQHGWAAGETQYPLSRDPFFLITSDGGQSWRQKPIGEEGTPGAIQRFWFDSPDHGELVVDAGKTSEGGRYQSYETRTGGDNWEIRGKTDQIPAMRGMPPADNSDYRVRTTKDGKSYQIEKRAGEQFQPVAKFLIDVATCKIQPGELKEPLAK
jgi:hypothetical protein